MPVKFKFGPTGKDGKLKKSGVNAQFIGKKDDKKEEVFDLSLTEVSCAIERAVSISEIVDSNGALLDDMGRKADVYRARAAFIGSVDLSTDSDKFPTIERGESFFDFIRDYGNEGVFIHPSRGAIPGRIRSANRTEKDELDLLEIEFEFVEEAIKPLPTPYPDVIVTTDEGFSQTLADSGAGFDEGLGDKYEADGSSFAAKTLDPDKSLLEQAAGYSKDVRDMAARVDSAIGKLEGTLEAIENPAKSLIAVTNFASTISGRILGSVAKCVERYQTAFDNLKDFPAKFAESLRQGIDDLEAALGSDAQDFKAQYKAVSSQILASAVAASYVLDEQKRTKAKQNEEATSFDAEGRLLLDEPNPGNIETIDAIDRSLQIARESLLAAIEASRELGGGDSFGLKISAEALQENAERVKIEVASIRTETIPDSLPLHLFLTSKNIEPKSAERTIVLNDIKNPTFYRGEVRYYEG
jgi:hypothetical protein